MSRSETRTRAAWASFDRWATWIIPALLAVPAVVLSFSGYGAEAGCCAAPAAVVATPPVATPTPSPAPVATVPAPAPGPAEPVVDCATIMNGVSVPFAVNQATLTAAGQRALDATVKCLGTGRYEVAGHTDADGTASANQVLSVARAAAAVAYLGTKGIGPDRLTAAGYGESQPIADNTTPDGKAKNRRITFKPL
jgi:outer membrane protein OmpA-like peptidoglycan-associated protein